MCKKYFINNTILLLAFLYFPLLITAQITDSNNVKSKNKITLGAAYSGGFGYRTLSLSNQQFKSTKNIRDSLESAIYSYSFGLAFQYNFSKRIAIETGAYYAKKGYDMENITVGLVNNIVKIADYKFNYFYLDIPISIQYHFVFNKLHFYPSLGFSLSFLLEQEIIEKIENETTNTLPVNSGSNSFNISALVGFGVRYPINDHLSLSLNPYYQYFINQTNNDDATKDALKQRLYTYGMSIGIYYSF